MSTMTSSGRTCALPRYERLWLGLEGVSSSSTLEITFRASLIYCGCRVMPARKVFTRCSHVPMDIHNLLHPVCAGFPFGNA
eukprot:1158218-Pelagomonas_calceolata.AAC.2